MRLKKLFLAALAIVASLPASAGLIYSWNSSTKTLTVTGDADGGTIPSNWYNNVDGVSNNKTVKALVLHGKVNIGDYAFGAEEPVLASVSFEEDFTGTSIGSNAFRNCNFTNLTIPASVTTINSNAFYQCQLLETITLSEGLVTIDQNAFFHCSKLKTITIPSTVTSIGGSAFMNCSKLESVIAASESKLATLGTCIFWDCNALKYIDFSACTLLSTTVYRRDGGGNFPFTRTPTSTIVYMPTGTDHSGVDIQTNVVVDGKCTRFYTFEPYIADGSAHIEAGIIIPKAFTADEIYTNRSIDVGKLGTVCLPYALPVPDATVAKVYQLTSITGNTLNFEQITTGSIAAYTPFVLEQISGTTVDALKKTTATDIEFTPATMPVVDVIGGYKMIGTVRKMDFYEARDAGAYIMQTGNKWQLVTDAVTEKWNVYIPPYRAYIVATGGGSARSLESSFGETTGIENIRTVNSDGTEQWYDLSGRRISQPQKGIHIVNGTKVLTK